MKSRVFRYFDKIVIQNTEAVKTGYANPDRTLTFPRMRSVSVSFSLFFLSKSRYKGTPCHRGSNKVLSP
jgi:hypothetical protein